jgi:SPP1 family predicted phage head-tail adaptor
MDLPCVCELNRRIDIREQTDIPAMGGTVTNTFSAPIPVWAKHQPVGNAIFFGTKQVGENITDRFIIRRSLTVNEKTVTANHVVEYDGQRYRVRRAADINGARKFVMLEVENLGNV